MKRYAVLLSSLAFVMSFANESNEEDDFSRDRLTTFYNNYFCEEKGDLASADLTVRCGVGSSSSRSVRPLPPAPVPPPNPPQPAAKSGYLPLVLVNDSGEPDSEVYVVVTGKEDTSDVQYFLQVNTTPGPDAGVGTLVRADPGDNALNYSLPLSSLPTVSTTGRLIYLPPTISGAIWISTPDPLSMTVNAPHKIVQPNFFDTSTTNFYDFFEYNYETSTIPNVYVDCTYVPYYGLSLYGYISTPSSGSASYAGLYQSKSYVEAYVDNLFASAPNASEWNKLFLKNGDTTLRILSPGKAMSETPTPIFDVNYLDNAAAYGYSYINGIWSGASSATFYKKNPLVMTIPNGTGATYTGTINSDNSITFKSANPSGYTVIFSPPTTTMPTTTYQIFSGETLVSFDNSPGQADGVQLFKLFEEAIIASLAPTANTLSNPYLTDNSSSYYTVNPNLTYTGRVTGPWYDLYSKALHALGNVYTFTYDEPLWPLVQVTADTVQSNTYLGLTIGSVK